MKKIRTFLFLLITLFGSYAFGHDQTEIMAEIESEISRKPLKIRAVKDQGLVLVLNDGSEWDIQYVSIQWKLLGYGWGEQINVSQWSEDDEIDVQYPGSGNFFDFVLIIKNLTKNEEAYVTLKEPPSTTEEATLFVVDYNDHSRCVTLNDGSVWFRTKRDLYGAFLGLQYRPQEDWEVGDTISLLSIEGWFNQDFLLWNHTTNEMPVVKKFK